ncbi:MAG: prepilin peptidase [Tissierellia bacterium]|nr:prepilin peptidase [Tissierellia bacterium]
MLILIYGLIIGSFLNVWIYRAPVGESIVWPGSHCPKCNTKLKWYDNLPVVSYLFLKGQCRYCRERISPQYPVVEFLNGIIYVIMFNKFGFTIDFVFYSLISSVLIVISFIDIKEMIIPDNLIIIILILSVLQKGANYYLFGISQNILNCIGGLLIAGGIFLAIVIVSRGGMGGGDITLIAALGFVLGIKYILLTIFLSFIFGAIISLLLLLAKIKTLKNPIPFGPFIILGFFITVLGGRDLINLYINSIL